MHKVTWASSPDSRANPKRTMCRIPALVELLCALTQRNDLESPTSAVAVGSKPDHACCSPALRGTALRNLRMGVAFTPGSAGCPPHYDVF